MSAAREEILGRDPRGAADVPRRRGRRAARVPRHAGRDAGAVRRAAPRLRRRRPHGRGRRCRGCGRRGLPRPAASSGSPSRPAFPTTGGLRGSRSSSTTGSTPAELEEIGAAATAAALGIGETGTIVLDGGEGQGRRLLSLVPDVHVCVLRADQIVDGVPAAIRQLAARPPRDAARGHVRLRAVRDGGHRVPAGRGRPRPAAVRSRCCELISGLSFVHSRFESAAKRLTHPARRA